MEGQETTVETQADASQLNAPAVEPASNNVAPEAMTLEELNSTLGKNFKDKASALQSLKELNSFVGKKVETQVPESIVKELKELKENQFYSQHPELLEHRALLSKLDSNPEVAYKTPEFQAIFTKAKGYDENQKLKTVLESNPRLSSSKDSLTKAREAREAGNSSQAEAYALEAVKSAYEM